MEPALRPASLAGTRLEKFFHTCAFVRSKDEECRILGPFVTEALEGGEKMLYIVDPALREEHVARLASAGVPMAQHASQFDLLTWHETYLHDGRFDQEFMLDAVHKTLEAGRQAGYPRMRIVGQMGWALAEGANVNDLIDYEVRVNEVLARTRNPAVCVYDVTRLSGTMMMDLLRAHPMTIVGGVLYENPFFTPPEEMLAELRSRKARAPGVA